MFISRTVRKVLSGSTALTKPHGVETIEPLLAGVKKRIQSPYSITLIFPCTLVAEPNRANTERRLIFRRDLGGQMHYRDIIFGFHFRGNMWQ